MSLLDWFVHNNIFGCCILFVYKRMFWSFFICMIFTELMILGVGGSDREPTMAPLVDKRHLYHNYEVVL